MRILVALCLFFDVFPWNSSLAARVFQQQASFVTTNQFSVLMPDVQPTKPETYLCTSVELDTSTDYYVVGFIPNVAKQTAHHILLYGCEDVGSRQEIWNCGEMAAKEPGLKKASPCKKGQQIIYAWANEAPKLDLPPGVAFHVAGNSKIRHIVLQVHYASVDRFQDGSTDDSGVTLVYTEQPQPKSAGVLLLATGGRIPANSVEHMEAACKINEDKLIYPFAFRTHTHALGRVVAGYKVERDKDGDDWTLLGKKDPQLPQMFYPVLNNITLGKGDIVAARCTMVSNRDWTTRIGTTSDDEMCNFYLMYWTDGGETLKMKNCLSLGPPLFYWSRYRLNNIPDEEASSL